MNSFVHLAYSDEPPPPPSRIAPIVIKTRPPVPSFRVTSRPNHGRGASVNILTTSSSSETAVMKSTAGNLTTTTTTTTTTQTTGLPSAGVTRPRSSTLVSPSSSKPSLLSWSASPIPSIPKANVSLLSSVPPAPASVASSNTSSSSGATSNSRVEIVQPSSSSTKTLKPPPRSISTGTTSPAASRYPVPSKPFANVNESPASSTGGSSSGKGVSNTPRDGSEIGDRSGRRWSPSKEDQWGSGVSGLSFGRKHGS
ncbi:hypothetical protein DFJ43DRAFT_1154444 [Lentinula guzmanii]|uniref:Uncharacterized protein n=1 Tax=Lentinula guzmanii TaxID=2804957 RepID=A0AA38JGZ4_9AGAR|nr:hypothetical protein DFJ43DRAFT_1154444 [Lentinula guzmanii]KAJ3793993.1 hypothetical protein GGU11DRAFT_748401 [Lentinula aff. detonsa]